MLAGDLSRSMQKDPTDYDAFSSALAESPFYKDELARRGLTPEAYRTSIEQAVKKTSGVGLPKEQAQYEAAMRFAKEVLFEDPAAIARFKQADAELFSRVKSWTERVHARLSGSSQENAANALWSMYDKADGGSGSGGGTGGSGRTDGPELPPTGDPERGNARTFDADGGREEETAPPANEETIAHENGEGYNEEGNHQNDRNKGESSKKYKAAKAANWKKSDGSTWWPDDDGFVETPVEVTLKEGIRIDRYGEAHGRYAAPEGTPYEQRALAPGSENSPYYAYEVIRPFSVKAGITAPWFDQPGGGTQYYLPMSIRELIRQGYIR